jgi:hypothetical protein
MNPRIKNVIPKEDYTLELEFKNGEIRLFDVKPYLQYEVFKELKNPLLFKQVKPFYGSIQWEGGQDLCPDTLYLDGKSIS